MNMDNFGKPDNHYAIPYHERMDLITAHEAKLKAISNGKVTSLTAYRLQRERAKQEKGTT